MAAAATLLLSGCGGGKKPNPPMAAAPAPPPPAPVQPVKPQPARTDQKPKESPKPAPKPEPKPAPAKKPPLPQDVAEWKAGDYYRAKAENSGKLPEALTHLAKRFAGTPKADAAAQLVVNLLKPEPPLPPAGTPGAAAATAPGGAPGTVAATPPAAGNVNTTLLKAEIEALSAVGGPVARKCLADLVGGEVPTVDGKQAAEMALEALAKNPSPEGDAVLYRLLTARGEQPPAATGAPAADTLQKKAYTVVLPAASAELRLKLAAFALEPITPQEQQETLLKFLQSQDPANVPAQILLYQSETTDKTAKAALEGYFQRYSSDALARVMGMSPDDLGDKSGSRPSPSSPSLPNIGGSFPAGRAKPGDDPDLSYRLVRTFWGKEFGRIVAGRLAELSSLESGAPMVVLAGTIPHDAMRVALYKALHRHREEGPKALETAGLIDRVFCDPGLLGVLKSMPRRAPLASHVGGPARTPAANPRTRPGTPSRPGGPAAKASKQLYEEDWMMTCGSLARAICHRFEAAARARIAAQRKAGQRVDFHDATAKRPVELHPGNRVVAEYHLDWPEGLSNKEKLDGLPLDAMTIHYVRMEERGKPQALEGYYRRKFFAGQTCPLSDGRWLESFHTVQHSDRKISYDLLITLPKEKAAAGWAPAAKPANEKTADQEGELVIEILYLDLKDPSGQSGGGAAESGKEAPEDEPDAGPASP
jgi:hypothetical protein